jgi:hypothetical protein
VDVADKFQEIGILLAENRFITVLKQMTMTIVSSVEGHSIARQESSHYRRYGYRACKKEEVDVGGDQGPTMTTCRGLFKNTTDTIEKIVTIFVIVEYLFPFYSSDNNMMNRSGSVYAGLTGHKCIILFPANKSIYNFMDVP